MKRQEEENGEEEEEEELEVGGGKNELENRKSTLELRLRWNEVILSSVKTPSVIIFLFEELQILWRLLFSYI